MFDKLIDVIVDFLKKFMPVFIIRTYERGVFLRMGIFIKTMAPGLHWKIPFFDECLYEDVVPTTILLPCQSLITKDDRDVVVKGVIKYEVADIKVLLLEVNDAFDAISDITLGIIKSIVMERTWNDCRKSDIESSITAKAKYEAFKWGIRILKVTLSDLSLTKSFRIFSDGKIATIPLQENE